MLHQAHGQLLLKLIDVVAGQAGLNENEEYARLREDIGRYIVELRAPTKIEFDMLSAKADELAGAGETTFRAAFEDPSQHVAPAYLKNDVLRAPAQNLNAAAGSTTPAPRSHALYDPYALENQRKTVEVVAEAEQTEAPTGKFASVGQFTEDQVALRARQELEEMTVAKAGATAPMIGKPDPSKPFPSAPVGGTTGDDASTGGDTEAMDSPVIRTDDERRTASRDPRTGDNSGESTDPREAKGQTADGGSGTVQRQSGDDQSNTNESDSRKAEEIDWEGTTVEDLKSYLDEQKVEYPSNARKADLVELAKKTYAEKNG